ncbi:MULTISPECIES: ABC transporter ATP-binding protein [Clostridium]|uniref:ABC-type multidrug transport system, ATPase component n=1 Tax=Clostridium cadaveris TaxID=1529 RepID=A0A1I2K8E0_9CLOT|nr:ABC transporter ATP-binding protein [Clostridium cadaveris]MDM8313076.1 ABC transporter ATP-binding protein [Clostridium cadaveris]MDU4950924.1 ABC transporter ATP-binding protein [Clostridium sp.]NME63327.1 ABC transporter ATP-binding protein [Clostridium cadaveris]SFF61467.1 ABC-type multidrug transport system, ATPase component [Clostridium cadaveris]
MNKLEIIKLKKVYKEKIANDDINLVLDCGVYGLLGANGAGKTTFMKQIVTLTKPTNGEILYNGKNIELLGSEYRELIGYLPQDFDAYRDFKIIEFMEYMADLKDIEDKEVKIKELLTLVGLHEVKNRKMSKLSGGMKRRVGIAQALLNDPKILVLDEPTAGLDPQERNRFRNLISNLGKEAIVILSTHIISDIEQISKEIIMIKNGKVCLKATSEELLERMRGNVFTKKFKSEDEIKIIEKKYKVVNVQRGTGYIKVRFISHFKPNIEDLIEEEPTFEDVYIEYFELEDAK